MKNKVLILIILLFLAAASAAAYYYYYFYYLPNQKQPGEENTPAEEGPTTVEYNGQYVSGETPENWTIVEYQNGAGSQPCLPAA